MELLQKLGIDWRLLIAQLVNFSILVIILYKLLYKPVLKVLNDRKEKIEQGLKDAKSLGEELERTKELQKREINKAKVEAREIIENAQDLAEKSGQDIKIKAKNEVEKLITAARTQIIDEKEKMLAEARKEISSLVLDISEKVFGKLVDAKINQKLIDESVKDIKKK
ncbi:ATP synthase F0 subunit B [Candidatus Falkowbacteria bacterium RIFOXYB2_FULL_38_15]|uniref:ATP synthase subunit b n=1 Tax=Candidatus Falkowbacteria bacterium RIFOXYA2_FULL_38_12 TaxID=1797993 RepID=A0A1F5S306_9BACT|nr:MAG: ATP synthase F0 subunit B [Candidatus Falkowbacteria bacterium RIFOXYA2_FULL_38_12]OGF32451.1 MAG: ATP synthase F0 subunit B [Candidatus Falkowbacteria bacterium RIFOXYB2_FULL_38_15]OGF42410.1 MAG: ATP synthase F0 subunit B [Candidatus Falkowbacteria bacterium RIFOXYD2_FULL_39_16]